MIKTLIALSILVTAQVVTASDTFNLDCQHLYKEPKGGVIGETLLLRGKNNGTTEGTLFLTCPACMVQPVLIQFGSLEDEGANFVLKSSTHEFRVSLDAVTSNGTLPAVLTDLKANTHTSFECRHP